MLQNCHGKSETEKWQNDAILNNIKNDNSNNNNAYLTGDTVIQDHYPSTVSAVTTK